jgi:hypothetical protein
MALILDGTNGLSDVDGSAATPAIRGSDANTGVFFPAADVVGVSTGGSERMRVDASGNVGIGVVPTAVSGFGANKLLEMGGASAPALIFRPSGSTSEHTVLGAGDGLVIGATGAATASNNAIRFFTSNTNSSNTPTERARIDSSGNVNINTTSNPVYGSTSARLNILKNTGQYSINSTTPSTGNEGHITFRNPNGIVGEINTNGSSTSYVTSSDYRLKHDIQPMTGALAKVAQLKPVTYKWNADDSQSQGFIAHELQEVVPECVTGEKDAVDAEGNPQYQGIDTSFLVATLTAAIQEQQAIITALTARVEALEGAQA